MALRLSHAALHVADMDNMLDYYTRVLGFAVTDRGPLGPPGSPEIVFLSQDPGEHHQLAFVALPPGAAQPGPLNHISWRTDDLESVKATAARIQADGRGRPPLPLSHGNTWSIYFADPEGNGVEVFCDTPWHVQQPQGEMWDMQASEGDLLAWTEAKFQSDPSFAPDTAYAAARKRVIPAE